MKLPKLMAAQSVRNPARVRPGRIVPALCFDPNAPIEMDFLILDNIPRGQLQDIATLSRACANVVQRYGQARDLFVTIPL